MAELRWALVGAGTAGRARARALLESPRDDLVAIWRGRYADDIGAPVVASFEAAIAAAEAVVISSPTEHHAAQVRAALQAGRHVVVDFPLARSRAEASSLFDLARAKGKVLHVEHIELLEAAGRTLCGQTRPELLSSVHVQFERSGPDDAGAPALALSNVARLHRLCALAGPVASIDELDMLPGQLKARLTTTAGVPATLQFAQGAYFQRLTRIEATAANGRWEQRNGRLSRDGRDVSLLGTRSLFASDQRVATARILDGGDSYVTEARILHVLEVMERLGAGRVGPLSP